MPRNWVVGRIDGQGHVLVLALATLSHEELEITWFDLQEARDAELLWQEWITGEVSINDISAGTRRLMILQNFTENTNNLILLRWLKEGRD